MFKKKSTKAMRPLKRSSRRTVAEMRSEMIENNGVFLDWSFKIKTDCKNNTPENRNAFNTISEKGFFVFENGCILPHPYYSKKGKDGPARLRGGKASMQIFHPPKTQSDVNRNEDGWPTNIEISHLCHWSACINPTHLLWEPRWKNWKRLYCFGCDCNNLPPCLNKFHPSSFWENESNWPNKIGYDRISEIKDKLPKLVKVLPKDHFKKVDLKAANRMKRLKKKRIHDKQTKRKKQSGKHK